MAVPATGQGLLTAGYSPVGVHSRWAAVTHSHNVKLNLKRKYYRVPAAAYQQQQKGPVGRGRANKNSPTPTGIKQMDSDEAKHPTGIKQVDEVKQSSSTSSRSEYNIDYFEQAKEMVIRSDGGPPRWFSPLECGSRSHHSPLLLFLPGIDGVGLGLALQHRRLGGIFDIWCLHMPFTDQTPFVELVKMVERTVRAESYHSPKRPIYLVGESLGGCLALAVAARNPDIDLVLILANPATCFNKSQLQPFLPLLGTMPEQLRFIFPYMLSLMSGIPSSMATAVIDKGFSLKSFEELSQGVAAMSSYLSVLGNVLDEKTLIWKLKMLESASEYVNSRLHAVNAQTLILSSGSDQLLPSLQEGERLRQILPRCDVRKFDDSGHALFLEDGFDLVYVIKGASFYRHAKSHDYVSDFSPPTLHDFLRVKESVRWVDMTIGAVMLSTLEHGKIVRGLGGIPSDGPVLFVGYHMLLGLEIYPLVTRFWDERRILLRGMAHPMMFEKLREGRLPDLSRYDSFRVMGAVPASATNLFRLLSSKAHVLLYPGGVREALHRKGEEYRLFWPEQSEFVRMAAKFGAKIIPFGSIGEDDIGQIFLDYDDQMKVPFMKAFIKELTDEAVKLRTESVGEVANQDVHLPIILPKVPGRFYFLFGKPIETKDWKLELRNREKAHELYLDVKKQVESCMEYLKYKRENDPYRNLFARLIYQATNGFDSEVPTFEL